MKEKTPVTHANGSELNLAASVSISDCKATPSYSLVSGQRLSPNTCGGAALGIIAIIVLYIFLVNYNSYRTRYLHIHHQTHSKTTIKMYAITTGYIPKLTCPKLEVSRI